MSQQCALPATSASDATPECPAWLAVGFGMFSGVVALGVALIGAGLLLGNGMADWEARVTLDDTDRQRWLVIATLCFLPLLTTALVTLAISVGTFGDVHMAARQRLRQVTCARTSGTPHRPCGWQQASMPLLPLPLCSLGSSHGSCWRSGIGNHSRISCVNTARTRLPAAEPISDRRSRRARMLGVFFRVQRGGWHDER